jgi:hypothetical protein
MYRFMSVIGSSFLKLEPEQGGSRPEFSGQDPEGSQPGRPVEDINPRSLESAGVSGYGSYQPNASGLMEIIGIPRRRR